MTWLTVLGAVTTLGLATRWLPLWFRLWAAPRRLAVDRSRERAAAAGRRVASELRLVFVVPAYQETDTLQSTVAALGAAIERSAYQAEIVVVTSAIEPRRATRELAEALSFEHPYLSCLEDESPTPSMAAQFNTGLAAVAEKYAGAEHSTYVVCYNADTTAAPDTVDALGDCLVATDLPQAAQLMCVSLRNLSEVRGPIGWYLLGAAYYQTRWALGFEFDMYRRSTRDRLFRRAYYFRGHGITLRLDTATELGGLSTETALEDLLLGFRLSLREEPVAAVPTLEATETPTSFGHLVAQKRHWFGGMWDALRYRQLMPAEHAERPARFRRLQLRSLYRDVGSWLLGPFAIWCVLLVAALAGQLWWAALPVANALLSAWLVTRAAHGHRLPTARFWPLALGVLAYSMTRNLGPLTYLARRLKEGAWR